MHADRSLDLTNLEETFEHDHEGIAEILEMALADTRERSVALETALGGADLLSAREYAHAIKGAASNVGAYELFEMASAIERAVREDELAAAVALLPAVSSAVSRFEHAVSAYRGSV